jgi:hypothetical protein
VRTHRYRITISGALGEVGCEAFGDFRIEAEGTDTALVGDLDQAALYGALNRILMFGLELLELTRLPDPVAVA